MAEIDPYLKQALGFFQGVLKEDPTRTEMEMGGQTINIHERMAWIQQQIQEDKLYAPSGTGAIRGVGDITTLEGDKRKAQSYIYTAGNTASVVENSEEVGDSSVYAGLSQMAEATAGTSNLGLGAEDMEGLHTEKGRGRMGWPNKMRVSDGKKMQTLTMAGKDIVLFDKTEFESYFGQYYPEGGLTEEGFDAGRSKTYQGDETKDELLNRLFYSANSEARNSSPYLNPVGFPEISFYTTAKGEERVRAAPSRPGLKGRPGKIFRPEVKEALQKEFIEILKSNYNKLGIDVHTHTLLDAIEQGTLQEGTGNLPLNFNYRIASLPRPQVGNSPMMMTRGGAYGGYGAIVFHGREAIVSERTMTFQYRGQWHRRHLVGPAAPKNIFELSPSQIHRLALICGKNIAKGVTVSDLEGSV